MEQIQFLLNMCPKSERKFCVNCALAKISTGSTFFGIGGDSTIKLFPIATRNCLSPLQQLLHKQEVHGYTECIYPKKFREWPERVRRFR